MLDNWFSGYWGSYGVNWYNDCWVNLVIDVIGTLVVGLIFVGLFSVVADEVDDEACGK